MTRNPDRAAPRRRVRIQTDQAPRIANGQVRVQSAGGIAEQLAGAPKQASVPRVRESIFDIRGVSAF